MAFTARRASSGCVQKIWSEIWLGGSVSRKASSQPASARLSPTRAASARCLFIDFTVVSWFARAPGGAGRSAPRSGSEGDGGADAHRARLRVVRAEPVRNLRIDVDPHVRG